MHHAREALQAFLRAQIMAAGIEQIKAADLACRLRRIRGGKQEAGVRTAGRRALDPSVLRRARELRHR